MHTPPVHARALSKSGMEALQRGDARGARAAFEQILAARLADASLCLVLAYACRSLKDGPAALSAVDNALAMEPRNLRALIFKADLLHDAGDLRGASSYYQTAIKSTATAGELPLDLRNELARAQTRCDGYAEQFDSYLSDQLSRRGLVDGPSTRRFRQSLDLLAGRKQRFIQEPHHYFFPELPQIQFFDRDDFPWLDQLEAQTPAIRAELVDILNTNSAFEPYVQSDQNRPQNNQSGMLNNPDWSAFYLWKNGDVVAETRHGAPTPWRPLQMCRLRA